MKIENLKVGKTYKNMKELCEVLEIKYPTSPKSRNILLRRLKEEVDIIRNKRTIKIVSFHLGRIKEEKKYDKAYKKLLTKIMVNYINEGKWVSESDFLDNVCIINGHLKQYWRWMELLSDFLNVDKDIIINFRLKLDNVRNQVLLSKKCLDNDIRKYKSKDNKTTQKDVDLLRYKISENIKSLMFKQYNNRVDKLIIKKIIKMFFKESKFSSEFVEYVEKVKIETIRIDNEINSKGRYTIKTALKRKDEFNKIQAIVYKIKCWDDYEKFYKIGITSLTTKKRFDIFKIPYRYRIIDEIHTNLYDAVLLENKLHEKNKEYCYVPNKKFGGYTECFNKIEDMYNDEVVVELNIESEGV